MQRYTVYFIWKLPTCFWWYHHPLSGKQTTISTESGIWFEWAVGGLRHPQHTQTFGLSVLWVAYATHSTLKPVPTLPRKRQIAITAWQIPDAVHTVVCAPDDGWCCHPKHVEQFFRWNELCNVVSCWIYTSIRILLRSTDPWILKISKYLWFISWKFEFINFKWSSFTSSCHNCYSVGKAI
jgi:hypothetical protein